MLLQTMVVSWPVLIVAGILACCILYVLLALLSNSIVYIPNNQFGIVERRWGRGTGVNGFAPMTLDHGAGFLPETLGGGFHFFRPLTYTVHRHERITVDGIAYLVARVGAALADGQALAEWPAGVDITDARGFLASGGQRGPQRRILRSGTYAPNLALFCVITDTKIHSLSGGSEDDVRLQSDLKDIHGFDPIVISNDRIGIVTVQDGPALQHGEIVAPTVGTDPAEIETFHNSFQSIPKFLAGGGRRGRQEQVLVDGTYFINRLFATIELVQKTKVDIGTVAVINSYVGAENREALTADNGRGRTVERGFRGIWRTPFEPGKYAINPYAVEVQIVPTTNFQLRWMEGVSGGQNYDDDLREIPVITRDAFEIFVPLSIVAHIAPMNAPHVIQRFSNVQRLVTQTLDPLVSAFFKDTVQAMTLLEFIGRRQDIQAKALETMKARLAEHRIDVEEVLLGTPKTPPGDQRMESVLEQLRLRQLAAEQEQTFDTQRKAAEKKKALNAAQALADQQAEVTRSELQISIAENEGKAEVRRKTELATAIKVTAEADAEAAKVRAAAVGGPEFLLQQLTLETLLRIAQESKIPLVPTTLVEGGGSGATHPLGALIAMLAKQPPGGQGSPWQETWRTRYDSNVRPLPSEGNALSS